MEKIIPSLTLLLMGFWLNIPIVWGQCSPQDVQGTYEFSDIAPTSGACNEFVSSQYSVWSNEAYELNDVVNGEIYVIDLCDATAWDAVLAVYDPNGNLVDFDDGGVSGCGIGAQVSFIAPIGGTYTITVGTADCATNQVTNGFIKVFNNSLGVAECPPDEVLCSANPFWVEVPQGTSSDQANIYCADILGATPAQTTLYVPFSISSEDISYNLSANVGTFLQNDLETVNNVILDENIFFFALTQADIDAANGSVIIEFEGTMIPECATSLTIDLDALGITNVETYCSQCTAQGVLLTPSSEGFVPSSNAEVFCPIELDFVSNAPTIYIPFSVFSNDANTFDLTASVGAFVDGNGNEVTTSNASEIIFLQLEEEDINALGDNLIISMINAVNPSCSSQITLETQDFDFVNELNICEVPVNDACTNAIALNVGENIGFNNVAATVDGLDPVDVACWNELPDIDNVNNSVWFSFEGDGNTYKFETTVPASEYNLFIDDTQIQIYIGDCDNLIFLEEACNDDINNVGPFNYLSSVVLPTTAGETYYILVDAWNGYWIDNFGITVNQVLEVEATVLLEGNYNDNTGLMTNGLQTQFLLPTIQPYAVAPWNHFEEVGVADSSAFPPNTVDWVLVEMRSGTLEVTGTPGTVLEEAHVGLLLTDGSIVDIDGNPLRFFNLDIGESYYMLVRHRNHLDVISSNAIVANGTISYDFSSDITQAFGASQQVEASDGKAMMYGGDYVPDAVIQNSDNDAWEAAPAILSTYFITDGTLDGIVQLTDQDVWFPNKAKIGTLEVRF